MDKSYTEMDHLNDLETAQSMFSKCDTLFTAILDIEELKNPAEFKLYRIRGLAEIGQSISQDWSNQFDCFRNNLGNYLQTQGGAK